MCYVIFELREILSHCIIEKKDIDIKNIMINNKGVENKEGCQIISIEKYLNNKRFGDEDNKYIEDFIFVGNFYIIICLYVCSQYPLD